MTERHQESNDAQILARTGRVRVNEGKKTLRVSKDAVIGIKMWGRIDYLCNHKGWTIVTD